MVIAGTSQGVNNNLTCLNKKNIKMVNISSLKCKRGSFSHFSLIALPSFYSALER